MDLQAFLDYLNSGKPVQGGSEAHLFMHGVSQEALRLTAEINGRYHEPEELRSLFSQLIAARWMKPSACFRPSIQTAERTSISAKMFSLTWAANFRTRVVFSLVTGRSSAQCGAGNLKSRHVPRGAQQHDSSPHPYRETGLDWGKCHHTPRRDHR